MPLSFISSLPLIHSLQLISPLQETLLLLPSASFRSGSRSGLNLKVCRCRLFHCHCSSPRCHSSPHYIKQHRVATFNEVLASIRRAFYDDLTSKGDNQPKSGRSDNRGITVTAKGAKFFNAAVAATVDAQHPTKEGEEKVKLYTHSYCCLDYAQIYDVVRYRLHRMKHKLKDELDNKSTIQCFDALQLISFEDDDFHCESCNGKLEIKSDKRAAQDGGDVDDNARRRRREKLKDMLQKLESSIKLNQQANMKKAPPHISFFLLLLSAFYFYSWTFGQALSQDEEDPKEDPRLELSRNE
ncbi:hypothetical protein S245_037320, partial [Arachis hypogaea]